MTLIILGIVAALGLLMFTKPGVLIKGFIGLFVKNVAQTPEGAEAIYQEAIEQTQDRYNEASDAVNRISGQLDTAKRNLAGAQARLKECEQKCQQFVVAGKDEQAAIYAEERELILEEVDHFKITMGELEPLRREAEQILQFQEKELKRLKLEQKTVVDNLRRNIQVKEMYDTMDSLKRGSNLDKMMGYVKDGAQEKREMAVGARVVHESKVSTKIQKADAEARQMGGNSYLESLKSKYRGTEGAGFEVKEKTKQ